MPKVLDSRSRYFGTIVYPESAPENWIQLAEDLKVPIMISPLHDKDHVNDDVTKELKKPHYHVIVLFDGLKSPNQARALFEKIGGVGCERIESIKGSVRYLCHLDNENKAKYNEDNIICLSGADYEEYRDRPSERYVYIAEMIDFCDSNKMYSFSELVSYARTNNQGWFRSLCDNSAYIMEKYLKSALWTEMHYRNAVCSENLSFTNNSEE